MNRISPTNPLKLPRIKDANSNKLRNSIPMEKGVTMTRNKPAKESSKPKLQLQFYKNLHLQGIQTLEV